ncbi:conserved hypothetical protein [Talaromyces stipitatus ATCC 10500]|uniref:Uncharacterized protein n=1 Tax=Talaromyces stipitatus (strain ATCC 10500 / CBS 375.48 / QM 6759 / NRRL 1006) TaxID=441959 RepID=B8MMY5_TALSN|nr:uncharacterized protein TSTA_101700 [Talaromyces stipitatus ATCC 10500]EED13934.1 conserved hypothetical protein [Talaromyces stipitatus ATCC 10500]
MSTKKDMRRVDLVIPYVEPPAAKSDTDISEWHGLVKDWIDVDVVAGAMSTTLPMAAVRLTHPLSQGYRFVLIDSMSRCLHETGMSSKRNGYGTDNTGTVQLTRGLSISMIGWVAVIISIQNWLSETPEQSRNAATPSYMSVFMSLMSLGVTYMPLFFPTPGARGGSSTAAAPAPSPTP